MRNVWELRMSLMLEIVIAVVNEKTGGGTKYINRRDRNCLTSAVSEENYHQKLTDAIRDHLDGHKTYKYSTIMDMIYKAVFCEKAKEFKNLIDLSEKDNLRRTLYAEVRVSVSAFAKDTTLPIVQNILQNNTQPVPYQPEKKKKYRKVIVIQRKNRNFADRLLSQGGKPSMIGV